MSHDRRQGEPERKGEYTDEDGTNVFEPNPEPGSYIDSDIPEDDEV